MRITRLEPEPFHTIAYRFAGPGGRPQLGTLPIYLAQATGMPPALHGLLLASDLQGVSLAAGRNGETPLLGIALAEEMFLLAGTDPVPPANKLGVILAGDLHGLPGKRGGKGDVRPVWERFKRYFAWVAGVAGNHDRFGNGKSDLDEFRRQEGIHYLDGDLLSLNDLAIGGVGGIIGNPGKPMRKSREDYLAGIAQLGRQSPDILVLHESPSVPEKSWKGNSAVRECLESQPPALTLCGHCQWPFPGIIELASGGQVMNLDGRAVLAIGEGKWTG